MAWSRESETRNPGEDRAPGRTTSSIVKFCATKSFGRVVAYAIISSFCFFSQSASTRRGGQQGPARLYNFNVTLLQGWLCSSAHRILIYRFIAQNEHTPCTTRGEPCLARKVKGYYDHARPQLSMQHRLRAVQSEKEDYLPRQHDLCILRP